jgi:hypothetical protein
MFGGVLIWALVLVCLCLEHVPSGNRKGEEFYVGTAPQFLSSGGNRDRICWNEIGEYPELRVVWQTTSSVPVRYAAEDPDSLGFRKFYLLALALVKISDELSTWKHYIPFKFCRVISHLAGRPHFELWRTHIIAFTQHYHHLRINFECGGNAEVLQSHRNINFYTGSGARSGFKNLNAQLAGKGRPSLRNSDPGTLLRLPLFLGELVGLVRLSQLPLEYPRRPKCCGGDQQSEDCGSTFSPFRFMAGSIPISAQKIEHNRRDFLWGWWIVGGLGLTCWCFGGFACWRGVHMMDEYFQVSVILLAFGIVLMAVGLWTIHIVFLQLNPL